MIFQAIYNPNPSPGSTLGHCLVLKQLDSLSVSTLTVVSFLTVLPVKLLSSRTHKHPKQRGFYSSFARNTLKDSNRKSTSFLTATFHLSLDTSVLGELQIGNISDRKRDWIDLAGRIEINHSATFSLLIRRRGSEAHTDASYLVLTLQQPWYLLRILYRNLALFAGS